MTDRTAAKRYVRRNMKTEKRKKYVFTAAILCFLVISVVVLVTRYNYHKGIEAVIINRGPNEMENVIVRVTGNHYPLGFIGVNSRIGTKVKAKGESHIEISYERNRRNYNLIVDCYFEEKYSGSIAVEIENDKIAKITNKILLSRY